MSKKSNDINNLLNKIDNFTNELKKFEIFYKNQDFEYNNKLNIYENKIDDINHELNNFKEIFEKTKEYLLLEIESSLDKHKQIQFNDENRYNELIILLKNNNDKNISSLSEEIGNLKQIITGKDELIKSFKIKDDEYNNQIRLMNDEINEITALNETDEITALNETEIKKITEEKDNQIYNLTNKNNKLNMCLAEKDNQIQLMNEKINEITALNETEIKKITEEKDNQIQLMNDEIK